MPSEEEKAAAAKAIEDLFGRLHTAHDAAHAALIAAEKVRETAPRRALHVESIEQAARHGIQPTIAETLALVDEVKRLRADSEAATYEYRAVVHPPGQPQQPVPLTKWDRSERYVRLRLEEWLSVDHRAGWVERRLVGPVERMEDDGMALTVEVAQERH